MRVDFLLLAIVAIFALAYQITWLFVALGVMLFALVLAEQSSAPKAAGEAVPAGNGAGQEKSVIVVQQQPAQPAFFDYFLAQQMHSAAEKEGLEARHGEVLSELKGENKHLKKLIEMEKKKIEKSKKEKK